jgi:hypothetical protein
MGKLWFEVNTGQKKIAKDLISKNKLGTVEHTCNLRYVGGGGRKIASEVKPR